MRGSVARRTQDARSLARTAHFGRSFPETVVTEPPVMNTITGGMELDSMLRLPARAATRYAHRDA